MLKPKGSIDARQYAAAFVTQCTLSLNDGEGSWAGLCLCTFVMFCAPNAKILTEVSENSYTPKNPVGTMICFPLKSRNTRTAAVHPTAKTTYTVARRQGFENKLVLVLQLVLCALFTAALASGAQSLHSMHSAPVHVNKFDVTAVDAKLVGIICEEIRRDGGRYTCMPGSLCLRHLIERFSHSTYDLPACKTLSMHLCNPHACTCI